MLCALIQKTGALTNQPHLGAFRTSLAERAASKDEREDHRFHSVFAIRQLFWI